MKIRIPKGKSFYVVFNCLSHSYNPPGVKMSSSCLLVSSSLSSSPNPNTPKNQTFPTSKPTSLLTTRIPRNPFNSCLISNSRTILVRASTREAGGKKNSVFQEVESLVGEDSAAFDLGKQKLSSWIYFTVILGVVLAVLQVAWIDNSAGFGLGKAYIDAVSGISDSHEVIVRMKETFFFLFYWIRKNLFLENMLI